MSTMLRIFDFVITILVTNLDIQIKHKYNIDLRIFPCIGVPDKDKRFCGIVEHSRHSKHHVFTFKAIFRHIYSHL